MKIQNGSRTKWSPVIQSHDLKRKWAHAWYISKANMSMAWSKEYLEKIFFQVGQRYSAIRFYIVVNVQIQINSNQSLCSLVCDSRQAI